MTNQKPKIKEIEFGDGGEREIIVSNQNSQIPQIQSESAQQAVVANNKPDIKLSGPQVTKKIAIFRLFPIISISQKIFSIFFLTLEKIGIDEKVICYHNISN